MFFELMFIQSLELVEAGAETPYIEAETFISEQLEPEVFELTDAAFSAQAYSVITQCTWQISVPGNLKKTSVLTSN